MSAESFPIERDDTYWHTWIGPRASPFDSFNPAYPTMWRVVLLDGKRSDMFNLTRAKAAAKQLYQLAHKEHA